MEKLIELAPSFIAIIGFYLVTERRLTRIETKVDFLIQERNNKKAGN